MIPDTVEVLGFDGILPLETLPSKLIKIIHPISDNNDSMFFFPNLEANNDVKSRFENLEKYIYDFADNDIWGDSNYVYSEFEKLYYDYFISAKDNG